MMTFLFFANSSLQKVSFEMNVEWLNSALKLSQWTSEHDRKIQRCKNNKCLIFNGIPSKNRQYFGAQLTFLLLPESQSFSTLAWLEQMRIKWKKNAFAMLACFWTINWRDSRCNNMLDGGPMNSACLVSIQYWLIESRRNYFWEKNIEWYQLIENAFKQYIRN